MSCWNSVLNFHEFYNNIKIKQASIKIEGTVTIAESLVQTKIEEFNDVVAETFDNEPFDDETFDHEPFENETTDESIVDVSIPMETCSKTTISTATNNVVECMLPNLTEIIENPEEKLKAPRNPLSASTNKRKPRKPIQDDSEDLLKYFDLRCDQCFDEKSEPLRFTSASENRLHYKTEHKLFNRCNAYCRLCALHQTSSSKMREHIRWHENPKEFACKFCKKHFQFLYLLRQHELSKHLEVDAIKTIKYLICDICGLKALTYRGIKTHMRQRHIIRKLSTNERTAKTISVTASEETFECPFCQKVFARQQNQKMHIQKIHQKIYSVICMVKNI